MDVGLLSSFQDGDNLILLLWLEASLTVNARFVEKHFTIKRLVKEWRYPYTYCVGKPWEADMESILATPSGIQVHIVNTLMKHSDRLAVPYLAKLVGRPRPVVDDALKRLEEAGLVRLDGEDAVLVDEE